MLGLSVLVCIVGAAVAAPPADRSSKDVEAYKIFLEKAKPNDGSLLEDAMALNPMAKPWENSGKYQGDILLNEQQIEMMVAEYAGTRNGLIWPQVRWPQNTIIWEFAPGHFTAAQQNSVIAAIRDIERHTCVRFRQRSNERDFIRVTGWQDGCYAHAGFWVGFGVHSLNLARGCFNHFIIIHEWLHVIGFMHMHQTFARDNYIAINWANVLRGMEHNFDRNSNQEVTMFGTPYEYASNQHYDAFAFSSNGRQTITPRFNTGGQMGQLSFVTGWDWLRVNRMYNCPGAWSATIRAEDANKPAQSA